MMGTYNTHTTVKCPYCKTECEADWVDVGVGLVQCGPFHCEKCRASQIGPYDKERELSKDEIKTGWYSPHSDPGSSVNTINGKIVGHEEAMEAYKKSRNKKLENLKEELAKEIFKISKQEAIEMGICIDCQELALQNCYSVSGKREYQISGLCEKCFDKIFERLTSSNSTRNTEYHTRK